MSDFLTSDIISFWKLEEASGDRIDSSDDNDLSEVNTVDQVAGRIGNAAHFTEADSEYLETTGNPANLDFGDEDFYFSAWVNLDTITANRTILSKWKADTSDRQYLLLFDFFDSQRFKLFVSSDGTTTSSVTASGFGTPSAGEWNFVEGWHNSVTDTIHIAVNNGTPDFQPHAGGINQTTVPFRMGTFISAASTFGNFMDGTIDAVGAWSRILNEEERFELYNGGSGLEYPFFTTKPDNEGDRLGGFMNAINPPPVSGFLGGWIEGGPFTGPTGYLGGFILSKVVPGNEKFALLGGYTLTDSSTAGPSFLGGFCLSLPLKPAGPAFLGGLVSGLFEQEEFLGGFCIGAPDNVHFADTRARTLVAVTSENVVDQSLEFDAQIIFKATANQDFNAKLVNAKTFQNDITALFDVQKFKIPPTVSILSVNEVTPSGALPIESGGARSFCVVASGEPVDGNIITNFQLDFGDPFVKAGGAYKPFFSISGFVGNGPIFSGCHDYDIEGVYEITARARDDLGMIGMAGSGLNLIASGRTLGIDFSAINISGVPRIGFVPPSLNVDFTTISSGIQSPPFTVKQQTQSLVRSPTDSQILWNLGNMERSLRKNPSTVYSSPGNYIPVLRYQYFNPSGQGPFLLSDSLAIGFLK